MTIYMQIKGVNGIATDSNHEGWLNVISVEKNNNRDVANLTGPIDNRAKVRPKFSDVTIIREVDSATPKLFTLSINDEVIDTITIHFCHGADTNNPYYKYVFTNSVITSHAEFAYPHAKPIEIITISYSRIEKSYQHTDKENKTKPAVRCFHNLR